MTYPATTRACHIAEALGCGRDAGQCLDLVPAALLGAIVRGEVDILAVARETLAARGCDATGRWVGFEAAERTLLGP